MRLGRAVRERRESMRITQTEAAARTGPDGVSVSLWRNIEKAFRPPFRMTGLVAVCQVLGWAPESVDLLLKGGDPIEVADEEPASAIDPAYVAELVGRLAELESWRAEWEPLLVHLREETSLRLLEMGLRREEIHDALKKQAESDAAADSARSLRGRRGA